MPLKNNKIINQSLIYNLFFTGMAAEDIITAEYIFEEYKKCSQKH